MTTGSVYKDAGEKKTSDICGEQGNEQIQTDLGEARKRFQKV